MSNPAPLVADGEPDPRPTVVLRDGVAYVRGWVCTACGQPATLPVPRCSACWGPMAEQDFGPRGDLWSWTVVWIESDGRQAPYALGYVDLASDAGRGPRILVHLPVEPRPAVGKPVRLTGTTPLGDPAAEVAAA